jgi:O-antigen ligase
VDVRKIYQNPALLIVCVLVVVTPLFRGAVHLWAETVIQMLVLTGVFFVLLEKIWSGGQSAQTSDRAIRRKLPGIQAKHLFWCLLLPCALLVAWSTLFTPQMGLAMEGMTMMVTYLALFYLAFKAVRTRKEQRILVGVMVTMALLLSIIGMLKRFDILVFPWWDYSGEFGKNHSGFSLSGVYVNRNHMAGFLEMVIPIFMGLFLTRSRPIEIRSGMICLALFLIVSQALTLSRGGWAATVGALVLMMASLLFKKDFRQKQLLISIAVGVMLVGIIILASTPVVQRITTLTQRNTQDNLTGRLNFWSGLRNMIEDNVYTGTGPGTFTEAFPAYQEPGLSVLPVYAHNDYLQFMADNGIFFIPLMLWLLFLFFRAGFQKFKSRSRQTMGISLGCMAAMVAILIHSFSDFNLHIPANIVLFTVISAMVLRPE